MAYGNMTPATPGGVASSAANNQIITNVDDLDTRVDTVESDITALETLTGDVSHGNMALDGRVTSLESASGGTKPVAWIVATSSQSFSANTWTKIALSGNRLDTVAGWIAASSRYTPNKAGWYRVVGQVCASAEASYTAASIYKNGGRTNDAGYSAAQGASAIYRTASTEMFVDLNGSNDYVELWGFVGGTGGAVHNDVTGAASYIAIEWVTPL